MGHAACCTESTRNCVLKQAPPLCPTPTLRPWYRRRCAGAHAAVRRPAALRLLPPHIGRAGEGLLNGCHPNWLCTCSSARPGAAMTLPADACASLAPAPISLSFRPLAPRVDPPPHASMQSHSSSPPQPPTCAHTPGGRLRPAQQRPRQHIPEGRVCACRWPGHDRKGCGAHLWVARDGQLQG